MRGSHRQFNHPEKSGTVTILVHPSNELHPKTWNSVLKQAGLIMEDGDPAPEPRMSIMEAINHYLVEDDGYDLDAFGEDYAPNVETTFGMAEVEVDMPQPAT